MRLVLAAASVLAISGGTALAVQGVLGSGADAKDCFERVYDAGHLARNSTQMVTRIRVSVSREPIPGSVGMPPVEFLRVELARRGEAQDRRIIAWCEHPLGGERLDARGRVLNEGTPGARCRITRADHMSAEEDDSHGHVDIRAAEGGLIARLSPSVRLRTGDKVSVDRGQMVRLGAADRVFRLTKVAAEGCEDLRRAIREE